MKISLFIQTVICVENLVEIKMNMKKEKNTMLQL